MKVLAIETSTPFAAVALLEEDRIVAEVDFGHDSRHVRDLLPAVDKILGGNPKAADLLAIDAGPGSYTGLRVGIAFAKTFSLETEIPVVTVTSFDVIARNVADRPLCVVLDARVGQVYAAFYSDTDRPAAGIVAAPADIAAKITPGTTITGDALRRYRPIFEPAGKIIDNEQLWQPRAATVARLGLAKYKAQGGENPHDLAPQYLRPPQAEVTWHKSHTAPGPK